VIRLVAPLKPGAARNRGAEAARGRILVFVDADVCVHPDVVRRMHEALSKEPGLAAVFGAYDLGPAAPGFVSQYRNLLHHYVHQRDAGEAVTFWTGVGAVRREAFEHVGRFDEGQNQLEDIELGYRLSSHGHRIELRPEIQGSHLKQWSLLTMAMADVRHRGVPWMRLLLGRRNLSRRLTLNVRRGEQLLTGLMGVVILSAAAALVPGYSTWFAAAALATFLIVAGNWPFLAWLAQQRGWWFALRAIPLRLLYYALNVVSVGLALLLMAWWSRKPAPDRLTFTRAAPDPRRGFRGPGAQVVRLWLRMQSPRR
jgi:uncharacterized membrane protein YphA (DoxX/SURF4 family)